MADAHDLGRLGPPVVRTAWVFQALIVGPAFIFTGQELFWTMWQYYHESWLVYPALRYLGFGILTAGIIFVLIVQWSYSSPHPKAFRALETSKAIFATAAWLWLLLDAIAYIPDYYDPYCRFRRKKIVLTAVSVVVLFLFFYPTVFWSSRLLRLSREADQEEARHEQQAPGEDTPLLGS